LCLNSDAKKRTDTVHCINSRNVQRPPRPAEKSQRCPRRGGARREERDWTGGSRRKPATSGTSRSGWNDGCRAARLGNDESPRRDRRRLSSGHELLNGSEVVVNGNVELWNGEVASTSRHQHASQSGWNGCRAARLGDESHRTDDRLLALDPDYKLGGEIDRQSRSHTSQSDGRSTPNVCCVESSDSCKLWRDEGLPPEFLYRTSSKTSLQRHQQRGYSDSTAKTGVYISAKCLSGCLCPSTASTNDREVPPKPDHGSRSEYRSRKAYEHADPCDSTFHRRFRKDVDSHRRLSLSQDSCDLVRNSIACSFTHPRGEVSKSDSRKSNDPRRDFIRSSSATDSDSRKRLAAAQDSCGYLAQSFSIGAEASNSNVLQKCRYIDPFHFVRPSRKDNFESYRRLTQESWRDLAKNFSSIPIGLAGEVHKAIDSRVEVPKPSSQKCRNYIDPCHFVCPPTKDYFEPHRMLTPYSCVNAFSPIPSRSGEVQDGSFDLPTQQIASSNLSAGGSPSPQRRRSLSNDQGSATPTAAALHGVTSTTDRPCEAFNHADVVDRPPTEDDQQTLTVSGIQSSTHRLLRSFPGGDMVNSSSRQSSIDRPARGFNSADAVDSLSATAGHDDSRHPSATIGTALAAPVGRRLDHAEDSLLPPGHNFRCPQVCDAVGGPSSGPGRQWKHFYVDCADQCAHCLGTYALCGACNAIHAPSPAPQHNADNDDCSSLPTASDLCQPNFLSNSVTARGRHSPPRWRNTTEIVVDDDKFPDRKSSSVRNIVDLSIDREPTPAEDSGGGGLLSAEKEGAPVGLRESRSNDREGRSMTSSCTRLRSLHFYTDCSDCPDCCTTSVCGSCCSVHGPPVETPGDVSPRCTKLQQQRRSFPLPREAESRDPCLPAANQQRPSCGDDDAKISCTDTRNQGDTKAVSPATDRDNTDNKPSTDDSNITLKPSAIKASLADSSDDAPDKTTPSTTAISFVEQEECWTMVEKTTCGLIGLLILVVFIAVYLQLSRRYFTTGVGRLTI